MKKISSLFLILLIVFSCGLMDKDEVVTVGKKYSLTLPSSMKKTTQLNDDASLQRMNALKELYVIVIDEPKEEMHKAIIESKLEDQYPLNIDGYSKILFENFGTAVKSTKKSSLTKTSINNMPARIATIEGFVDGHDIHYAIAYVEGVKQYYQIMTWTLSKKQAEHKEKMDQILRSFKEL
jgi:hypothetical protein